MDIQPVETTLYSLSEMPPVDDGERRQGERHMTLYRVGAILIEDRRELCLIKNISAGGMMIRLYSPVTVGVPISVELKSGQPVSGKISWVRDSQAGIVFDTPIDVIELLSASMDGPRPRMPRIATCCDIRIHDGNQPFTARGCDISQGGVKIECRQYLPAGTDVVVTLAGLEPRAGIICWCDGEHAGITFNRLLPLNELVGWLQSQRNQDRLAG